MTQSAPDMSETDYTMLGVRALLIPAALAGLIAYQSLTVAPLVVGALIDHRGFSTSQAGIFSSLELLSMAAVAILLAPNINRLHRQRWAFGAALVLALMQFSSAWNWMPGLFYLERMLAGASAGILVAILAATIPLSHNPERLTALIILFDSAVAVLLYLVLPYLIEFYALAGAYGFLAVMTLISAPVFLLLPASGPPPTPLSPAMRGDAIRLACYAVLVATAGMALWSFTERMGVAIGLDLATIGTIFAASIFVGLAGAGLAAAVGQKWGSFWPVLIGGASLWLCSALVPQASVPLSFIILFGVSRFAQNFTDPFLVAVVARLDTQGRLMGVNAGVGLLGAALGPFLAGMLVEGGAFHRLSYLYIGLIVTGFAFFWPYLWRDRTR